MFPMIRRLFMIVVGAAALAGCGSSPHIGQTPVDAATGVDGAAERPETGDTAAPPEVAPEVAGGLSDAPGVETGAGDVAAESTPPRADGPPPDAPPAAPDA